MKFGNLLRERATALPEYESLFQFYKQLKKKLKGLQRSPGAGADGQEDTDISSECGSVLLGAAGGRLGAGRSTGSAADHDAVTSRASSEQRHPDQGREPSVADTNVSANSTRSSVFEKCAHFTAEEANFLYVLSLNLDKFNQTFLETEEGCVIRMRELTDSWSASTSDLETMKGVYRQFIDLHGEILLLMNWSMLAYTSIVKILKKHEKHTGHKLIAPHMEDLLNQPFCSTEATTAMAHKAKSQIEALSAAIEARGGCMSDAKTEEESCLQSVHLEGLRGSEEQTPESCKVRAAQPGLSGTKRALDEADDSQLSSQDGSGTYKRTQAALETWETLFNQRSTPSNYIAPSLHKDHTLAPDSASVQAHS